MFLNKKCKNFVYTLIYLLPFFLFFSHVILSFSSFRSFDIQFVFQDEQDFHYGIHNYIGILFTTFDMWYDTTVISFFEPMILTFIENGNLNLLPVTNVFDIITDNFISGNDFFELFYGFSMYLDYCIYVSFGIIVFEVITLLPVICRRFLRKLSD